MATKPGFLMFHNVFRAIDELPNKQFRTVMRAVCDYSESGKVPVIDDPISRAFFSILQGGLDQDAVRYDNSVGVKKRAAEKRWKNAQKAEDAADMGEHSEAREQDAAISERNADYKGSSAHDAEAPVHDAEAPVHDAEAPVHDAEAPVYDAEASVHDAEAPVHDANACRECQLQSQLQLQSQQQPEVSLSPNLSLGQGNGRERRLGPSVAEVQAFAEEAGIKVDARRFVAVNRASGWLDGNGEPIKNWKLWLQGYTARGRPEGRRDSSASLAQPDPRVEEFERLKRQVEWEEAQGYDES